MAGVAGLEPTNGGIKTRCLTNLAIPQMVRKERLELSRREALEPKSSVSTNFTTSAFQAANSIENYSTCNTFAQTIRQKM